MWYVKMTEKTTIEENSDNFADFTENLQRINGECLPLSFLSLFGNCQNALD